MSRAASGLATCVRCGLTAAFPGTVGITHGEGRCRDSLACTGRAMAAAGMAARKIAAARVVARGGRR